MTTLASGARRAAASATVALALVAGLSAPAGAAASRELLLTFDNGETFANGSAVQDTSGAHADGVVKTRYGAGLSGTAGVGGSRGVRFPAPCSNEPCPNAMIKITDRPGLDVHYADFEWGAEVNLTPSEVAKGANVVQKGRYSDSGGQWKLQIDGFAGKPSCIVSGVAADGRFARALVYASVSVADGRWHQVTCRRAGTVVTVFVDGVNRGSGTARVADLASPAPVTVGAKTVRGYDNDQFFGRLDNVFMQRI